ncbi:UDP-N-acetylmuramoyl-L-alanine--D-glutamate ligase [Alcaligenaceae bacterium B3P038]|nr:UDP-N-acetylmuramoyl-L-alanine--D-glutamate ligase [Alcaligenaceae bacterium B3P038]
MNDTAVTHAAAPHALILGLGETGVAAARWCVREGVRVTVADTRAQPAGIEAVRALPGADDVTFALGQSPFDTGLLAGVTQIVLSPGLAPTAPEVVALLAQAQVAGIEVVGEIELFARALTQLAEQQEYRPRVLAVTGTNGKTTVTALARQMVEAGGLRVRAAGNISPAALTALIDALDENDLPDVWVIELSSFQLETTTSLVADAAVVLNVTQDHLDWHGDMAAYTRAKARIFARASIAIVNRDDAAVMAMVPDIAALTVRSFGRDLPPLVGDLGLETGNGVAWLVASESTEFDDMPAPARRKKNAPPPVRAEGRVSRLMPVDAMPLRGLHNATNVLAALALGRALDIGWGPMLRAVREYAGEPHRAQFVRTIQGVDFINDSKGTNVGATVAALEGLGQQVVLIAGGLGKGQDFSPLQPVVAQHARTVVLIGQDARLIGDVLASTGVPLVYADTLDAAVTAAMAAAQAGDAVLLSPACASMDMFRNYPHRGQSFIDAVSALALDHGEIA